MRKHRTDKRKKRLQESKEPQTNPGYFSKNSNHKQFEQQEKQKFNQMYLRRFR